MFQIQQYVLFKPIICYDALTNNVIIAAIVEYFQEKHIGKLPTKARKLFLLLYMYEVFISM